MPASLGFGLGLSMPRGRLSVWSPVRYTPGDTLAGESFTRAGDGATQVDAAGLVARVAANVKRDAHYIGGVRHFLRELTRTNVLLWRRDLTNAAWVKTNATVAKNQTGADGVLNSASSITATLGNATVLQATTLASSRRIGTAYVKRITGVGTIQMTLDGGATWTTITVTGAWTRPSVPFQLLTNPSFGFRIVTSGDAIAVDYVQNEDAGTADFQAHTTTPIDGVDQTVACTRTGEEYRIPFTQPQQEMTLYADFIDLASLNHPVSDPVVLKIGADSFVVPETHLYASGGSWQYSYFNGASTARTVAVGGFADGDRMQLRAVLGADGSVTLGGSRNGGAESVTGPSAALALEPAWSAAVLHVGSSGAGSEHLVGAFRSFSIVSGTRDLAYMAAL